MIAASQTTPMVSLFWGIVFLAGSICTFAVVIFRPEFLKSVRRSRSKYHLSRLGGASCGVGLCVIGIAGVLHGLTVLSGVYLHLVVLIAIVQLLAIGFYDTYRNSRRAPVA
jgi:Flp pilus assembly protein TadB